MSVETQFIIKSIRLQKSANWVVWLFFIRIIIENDKIWNLIDFDKKTKSDDLSKSQKSFYEKNEINIDLQVYAVWKARIEIHNKIMTKYERQRKVFKQLIKHIHCTISSDVVVLIANESSHSYNLLRALKLRFAFIDQIKKIQIEMKYHELCKKSENQNLKKWLNEWRKIYITNKTLNVYEIIKKRSIKNFIYSIMNKNKIWTNVHLVFIDEEIKKDSLFNLIAKFRNHDRMKSNKKLHQSAHSTFSASCRSDQNQLADHDQKSGNASFRDIKQQSQKCLCDEMHW